LYKTVLLFLKLDFAKAFYSVLWDYLLEVLHMFGFGHCWRRAISLLLSTASSRILLNGEPGPPIFHQRGLRQGDPLAPMMFILALEPLQRLLKKATESGLLSPLSHSAARMRASFYADDAALFVNPTAEDVSAVFSLLDFFGNVSGLRINLEKCTAYPIRCEEVDTQQLLANIGCSSGVLPCTYLGLPLGF
jgi:hypothetical protein